MDEKKIVAIMPIKLNNERLPGKNTKLLGSKPLIQYQLEALVEVEQIQDIFVFCSDDQIQQFLIPNVKFLKRDSVLDLPTSNFTQIFESFYRQVPADIYVYAHATAPFVTQKTIRECIDAVRNNGFDSAFCASKIQDYLWQDGKPLNFDASNLPRSQDLSPIYRETSGVYVFTKEVFTEYKRRVGNNPYVKEVTFKEAVDINNPEEFDLAQALLDLDIK